MGYKFNWTEYHNTLNKKEVGESLTPQEIASFITTCGAVVKDDACDIADKLIETNLAECEMKLTVNGIELNIERVLDRLSTMITAQERGERLR